MNKKIKVIKIFLKNIRDTLSRDETNKIRTKLYKKEVIYDFLKENPQLDSDERKVFKRIPKYLKKI